MSGFAAALQAGLDEASLRLGRPPLRLITDPFDGPGCRSEVADRFARRSFVALIDYDLHAVYVIPDFVRCMPPDALRAMAAHEAGHEADWLARLLSRISKAVLGKGGHDAWRRTTAPARERFADRVAASLVGRQAVLDLLDYVPPGTSFEEWDGPYRRRKLEALMRLPERPSLPFTLRVAEALRRALPGWSTTSLRAS